MIPWEEQDKGQVKSKPRASGDDPGEHGEVLILPV